MSEPDTSVDLSIREKARVVRRVANYRPLFTAGVLTFAVLAAVLEAVGLTFIIPIVELAQSETTPSDGMVQLFVRVYDSLGIPFSLGTVIAGVALVLFVRFSASFAVSVLWVILRTDYERHLKSTLFERALNARIAYFDERGSDEVLNAVVTQAQYASRVLRQMGRLFQESVLAVAYLAIALYLSPVLTVGAAVVLGGIAFAFRKLLAPGYDIGDRIADANERIQETVQAGTQGIRDMKLFTLTDELFADFSTTIDGYVDATVKLRRNKAALSNFYQFTSAVAVFVLIYFALNFTDLTFAALGAFLFAMFRLAPRISTINNLLYQLEGDMPHLVRTEEFIDDLETNEETDTGTREPPEPVTPVSFEDVTFGYEDDERVLDDVSFAVDSEEYVAFVGESGAGKSTVVSLLTRFYTPDSGRIRANDVAIDDVDLEAWRQRLAVVRQQPFLFNDTLRYNLTVGNREADQSEIERVCEIARVTEFLDDLPDGYDTVLGDDGVRLSGGQRQRVALARALLKRNAEVLVLDEATSDLDSNIEAEVQSEIESMDRDFAIVAIAHRLSTVKNADRIYTIADGEIIERGTHETLLDDEGKYADLYSIQRGIQK
jgi:subfamily B ATP-binding cassette protein MsbA